MGTQKKLYFENVRVGEELPPLLKPTLDRVAIARYAGAIDDFNPLCVDEDYARRSGFPTVCVQGMLAMGFLGQLASDWLRPGQIKRFSARFVKIIWPGDSLVCRGRIVDKRREGADHYVDLELWVENQKGELVVKGTASTKLYYNLQDEDRSRRGLLADLPDEVSRPTLVDVLAREIPTLGQEVGSRDSKGKKAASGTKRKAAKPSAAKASK